MAKIFKLISLGIIILEIILAIYSYFMALELYDLVLTGAPKDVVVESYRLSLYIQIILMIQLLVVLMALQLYESYKADRQMSSMKTQ